jgi:hypothetical protein
MQSIVRTLLVLPLIAAASLAVAQPEPSQFPGDAAGYLNEELPRMEAAIAARDGQFFQGAMARTLDFSERWGFKEQANPALAAYSMCTDAVMDYVIVGRCRLTPISDLCEPGLAPRFESNLQRCRAAANQR